MKKIKISLITIILLFAIVTVGGSLFMFSFSLKTKVKPTDEQDAYAYLFRHDYLKQWIDSLNECSALCDTFIVSQDGTKLHALYVKSAENSPNTALIIHGYTDNAIRMLMIGHIYSKEMGYNILLPDLRAHGKSEGEYIQMGWKDRLDIRDWIDVSKGIYGDTTNVVLHGISMGAAAVMMISGEELPNNVKCFVEDCGYTSVWDEFRYELDSQFDLPAFPLLHSTSLYSGMKVGWNFKEASSLEQIKKCKLPMFFIHGDKDTYVPTWMVYDLYEAKSGEKELWVVPGVAHAQSYWDYTDEYVDKTKAFVEKHISTSTFKSR